MELHSIIFRGRWPASQYTIEASPIDVSFEEDRCRTNTKNGAQNRNTLRKLSLQLLKQTDDKHRIKVRRKKAGWDANYLIQIIRHYYTG